MYPIGYAFLSLQDFLSPFYDLIITIFGVVIAEVALYKYMKAIERPRIIINTVRKGDRLGFSVNVERKTVKDARIRCNNVTYPWEGTDDKVYARQDLYVGDTPLSFFPFQVSIMSGKQKFEAQVGQMPSEPLGIYPAIVLFVKEVTSQKVIHTTIFPIEQKSGGLIFNTKYLRDEPHFNASIRVIGEGIEVQRDYSLRVSLSTLIIPVIKEGMPLLDYVTYNFELKRKRRLLPRIPSEYLYRRMAYKICIGAQ